MSHDVSDLMDVVRELVDAPLAVDNADYAVRMPRIGLHSSAESYSSYLKYVFGWIPFNPNKRDYSAAIRETFMLLPDDLERPRMLPTALGFRTLFQELADDSVKVVFITGNRGSGKTTSVNYFLENYHAELNSRGRTWIRSDISKLYAVFRATADGRPISLHEYQDAHTLLVVLRYAKHDQLLKGFHLADRTQPGSCPFYSGALLASGDHAAMQLWDDIVRTYDAMYDYPLDFTRAVVEGYARGAKRDAYQRLIARLLAYVRRPYPRGQFEPGERPANTLIQIVEGIDNIDKRRDVERYRGFLTELLDHLNSWQKQKASYDKIAVILRRDTLADLQQSNHALPVQDGSDEIAVYEVEPLPPAQLVRKKCQIASAPASDYFKNKRSKAVAHATYNVVWEEWLPKFAMSYFAELGELVTPVRSSSGAAASVDSTVLNAVFNDDLRACVQNLLNTFRYARSQAGAGEPGSLADLQARLRTRGQIVLEGSATDGQPTMPDNRALGGRWCPNMFFYEASGDPTDRRWRGLVLLRALQILDRHNDVTFTEASLAKSLERDFSYSVGDLTAAINVAWDFGLIRPCEMLRAGVDRIKITTKGRFVMRLPFSDPAITYFMGTTARLNVQALDDSKTYEVHDPRPGLVRRFVPAVVKTGVTVIRHVRSTHLAEMNNSGIADEVRRTYELPSLDDWYRRIEGYGVAYQRDNPSGFNALVNDLKGIRVGAN